MLHATFEEISHSIECSAEVGRSSTHRCSFGSAKLRISGDKRLNLAIFSVLALESDERGIVISHTVIKTGESGGDGIAVLTQGADATSTACEKRLFVSTVNHAYSVCGSCL